MRVLLLQVGFMHVGLVEHALGGRPGLVGVAGGKRGRRGACRCLQLACSCFGCLQHSEALSRCVHDMFTRHVCRTCVQDGLRFVYIR